MTRANSQEWSGGVKLLSLLLAGLLWLSVVLERPGEVKLQVPVLVRYLPAGVGVVSPVPASVEVTISGPRILLCRLPFRRVSCGLDLSGAAEGTASFTPKESSFGLDRELKVLRIFPAAVSLTLAREGER
ncbi:MAG: hypothetical protein A2075_15365 [Geobacteraceae bacterium GWC2_58_44]|nr:MAG: hypothetical protein A2075_15365 [Geobacteraceae bacterium GWC2_58_44]HBG07332.1 hypothetical protein [Geobacter sp.]